MVIAQVMRLATASAPRRASPGAMCYVDDVEQLQDTRAVTRSESHIWKSSAQGSWFGRSARSRLAG